MAYAATSDFHSFQALDDSDTADDALIAQLLTRAQSLIETETRRVFEASADTTRYFSPIEDTDYMWLLVDHDLCAITSIEPGDGNVYYASDYPVSDGTNIWVTEPANSTPWHAIKLLQSAGLVWTYETDPENAIAVAGRWAYSTTAPADIVHATVRLAVWLYHQRDAGGEGDRVVITADGSAVLPSRLPADVADICSNYVRRKVGSF